MRPRMRRRDLHQHLQQANFDYERKQFNTVASAAMKILNLLEGDAVRRRRPRTAALLREGMSVLLRLLSPITPHIAQALWRELGFGADILEARLAGSGRGRAGAGRDRPGAAGQRQASRQHPGGAHRRPRRHRAPGVENPKRRNTSPDRRSKK